MTTGEVRKCLIEFCENTGVKYTYIANRIEVHKSTLSHFIINDRKVSRNIVDKIINYLKENNAL
ncbi:hypothetical protein GCM10008905_16590 [Clostridium malenominatum]|uniref:XRE family transcriptional regulator n=1 Tax=Clostridium malenominatum TaxID=1539 RepID=A0ABN1IXY3_9CLOT